ncbi:hypothetical protein [Neisseria bacilliformis]|uniref:hypothetical protein n=1 Tax=Neisseria bacilliformis TaxID=267212 RepID=UPI0028EE8F6D|nr:hypothetical protein [Neisseria bacilliformis]
MNPDKIPACAGMTMFVQRDSGRHKADVGCVAQPRTRFGSGGKNKRPSESATSAQPKPVLRFFRRPLYVFGIPFIAQTQRPIKKFDKQSLPKSVFPFIIRAHTDSKTRSRLLSPSIPWCKPSFPLRETFCFCVFSLYLRPPSRGRFFCLQPRFPYSTPVFRRPQGLLATGLAAVFLVKNTRLPRQKCPQVSNLAVLFSLHPGIFSSKNRSHAECQQTLLNPFMRKAKITRLPIAAKQGKMASLRFFTFPKPIRRQP